MTDQQTYQQLQPEDRMTIASMLHRSPSTISRELARNTPVGLSYGSHGAQSAC